MRVRLERWLERAADLLWPIDCVACAAPATTAWLCLRCRDAIVRPLGASCPRCRGRSVDTAAPCDRCRRHSPAFDSLAALGPYDPDDASAGPLVLAVRALKYDRRRPVAGLLGALLATHYPYGRDALVVPVPLHRGRLRERGFNQAGLLAQTLARRRGLDLAIDALARDRPTATQAGLADAAERRRNLAAAIRVRRPGIVRDRDVVLIDDVVTTGSTADACASALRAAGARRIDVYAVGRTP